MKEYISPAVAAAEKAEGVYMASGAADNGNGKIKEYDTHVSPQNTNHEPIGTKYRTTFDRDVEYSSVENGKMLTASSRVIVVEKTVEDGQGKVQLFVKCVGRPDYTTEYV